MFNLHFIKIDPYKNTSNKGPLQQDFTNYEKLWAVARQSSFTFDEGREDSIDEAEISEVPTVY